MFKKALLSYEKVFLYCKTLMLVKSLLKIKTSFFVYFFKLCLCFGAINDVSAVDIVSLHFCQVKEELIQLNFSTHFFLHQVFLVNHRWAFKYLSFEFWKHWNTKQFSVWYLNGGRAFQWRFQFSTSI